MSAHRLPSTVRPQRYDLHLRPDIDAATFSGEVTITAVASAAATQIVLNAIELDIDTATINGNDALNIELDEETERATLTLREPVGAGPVAIVVRFRGILNDKLHGFYRSTFDDGDGVTHTIATTQCQATDARRCFPCFDEPAFKAVFSVSLTVKQEFLAISNGGEISSVVNGDGTKTVTFADTMPMSTYLVAFVVGPLDITDPLDVLGVPVRIVHVPGKGGLTGFALETTKAALEYFSSYYEIAYPSDKLDLVAIPDFAFGAMENLGCVTFREVLLLIDPESASQPELQNVADVINHELAHMWFGDLVTMSWWNGIWLNEAFATFMEMKATDNFKPEWDRWTSFGISRSEAFATDSLASTRPIEFEVVSPADADGMFDVLTYEKGAAVVRMLEQFVGESTFRDGIREYLRRHSYGNTETHDLWDAIEDVSGEPVRSMMDSWIFQGGYPLIDLSTPGVIQQRRFRYDESDDGELWHVPVFTRVGEATSVTQLDSEQQPFDSRGLIAANAAGSGFYRVRLPDDALQSLSESGPGALTPVEQYGIVDDAWALTLAGDLDVGNFLSLIDGFAEVRDVSVWQRMLGSTSAIRHVLEGEDRAAMTRWIRRLLLPLYAEIGWEPRRDETDRERQFRGAVLASIGVDGWFEPALQEARIRLDESTDPEVQAAATQIIAAHGSSEDFATFRRRMHEATTPQTERRYLYALTAFPGSAEIASLCEACLNNEIRSQDGPYVLGRSLTNDLHGPMVWEFITAHWDAIADRFPSNSIVRMLGGITSLSDDQTARAVVSFLKDHPVPQGARTLEQHLERLETNRRFRSRAAAEFRERTD